MIDDSLTQERIKTSTISTQVLESTLVSTKPSNYRQAGHLAQVDVNRVCNRMKADPDAPFRTGNPAVGGEQVSEQEEQQEPQQETDESLYVEESKRRIKETTQLLVGNYVNKSTDYLSCLRVSYKSKACRDGGAQESSKG